LGYGNYFGDIWMLETEGKNPFWRKIELEPKIENNISFAFHGSACLGFFIEMNHEK
jgi:hypothetical protein